MLNLTEKELVVLKGFARDDYISSYGWSNPEASTWVVFFHTNLSMTRRSFSGVMASLVEKKLVETDGEVMNLTDAGRQVLRELAETDEYVRSRA